MFSAISLAAKAHDARQGFGAILPPFLNMHTHEGSKQDTTSNTTLHLQRVRMSRQRLRHTTIHYACLIIACLNESSRQGQTRNHSQQRRWNSFPPPTRHRMVEKNGDGTDNVTYMVVGSRATCNTTKHGRKIPKHCSRSIQLLPQTSVVTRQMHIRGRPNLVLRI